MVDRIPIIIGGSMLPAGIGHLDNVEFDGSWSGNVGGGSAVANGATLSSSTPETTSPFSVRSDSIIVVNHVSLNLLDQNSTAQLKRLNANLRLTNLNRTFAIRVWNMGGAGDTNILFPAGRVNSAGPENPIFAWQFFLGANPPLIGNPLVLESNVSIQNSDGVTAHNYASQTTWDISFYRYKLRD